MAKKLLYQVQKTGKTYWREILAILFLLVGIFFFRSERRELRSLELGHPLHLIEGVDGFQARLNAGRRQF